MRKFTKFVAVLFIIALIFGCASSKSSKSTATGAEQKPTEAPSATIHFEAYQFMAILEGGWGHGTLAYKDKVYKFKTSGMGAGGWGGQKISGTGNVYYLKDVADFAGKYSELRGGVAGGKGAGALYLKNDETGVAIEVKTHAEGLAMSIGVTGVTIQMVDEK
jgi:major membrane immunogen (membrane-anchored lipoprotein)